MFPNQNISNKVVHLLFKTIFKALIMFNLNNNVLPCETILLFKNIKRD